MKQNPLSRPPSKPGTPLWKIPHVMVVPALLLVGVMSTSTMVVTALLNQDPLLDRVVFDRELRAAQALEGQARIDAMLAVQPARQARNHAASPYVQPLSE